MTNIPKNNNWEELIRDDLYAYNVSIPLHSIRFSNQFLGGPKYEKLIIYIENRLMYYYENFADHFRVGNYCLKLFLKNRANFKKYLCYWHKEFGKLNKFIKKIRQTDFSKLDKYELADLLESLYSRSVFWHGIAYNVDAIDAVLNPLMEKIVAGALQNQKKSTIAAIYNQLTFPDVLSYANRVNLEKTELFLKIKQEGLAANQTIINNFIANYYWVNFKFGKSKEYSKKELLKECDQTDIKKIKEEYAKLKDRFDGALKKKKIILNKIAEKRPVIKKYIEIFDAYVVLHDFRKEGQVKSVFYMRKIYDELSKKLKIKNSLIYYFWPNELIEAARCGRKPDFALLKKRSKKWYCEYNEKGQTKEEYGEKALLCRNKTIGLKIDHQCKELSGVSASQGRVKGTARICYSAKEAIKKIGANDILVTGMTMPEFTPAMKKALATVTDEGGLTCHAAIISRELGKPCVVGTRLATRLIKDGDMIEVNANHGVVKIIK